MGARAGVSGGLVALTSVLLVVATIAAYARVTLVDSEQFADRATASLRDDSVRTLIADRVTDEVILRQQADLLSARPVISSAIAGVIGSGAFSSLFRRAVLDVHRAVFARDQDTVTLTLADVGTVAASALQEFKPKLAAKLEDSGPVTVLSRDIGSATADLARAAERLKVLAIVLAALTVAAAAAALATSADRRHTASRLGAGAVAAGLTIVVVYTIARPIVLNQVTGADERAAAGAVWDAYVQDLRTIGLLIAGSGAVVAAAAASLLRPVDIEGPLRAAWRWVTTEPARPRARALRAGVLVAAGVLVILEPASALQIAATLVGLYLLFSGVTALLRLIYRPTEVAVVPADRRRPHARRFAVAGVAVALVGAGTAALLAGGGTTESVASVATCNGSAALCDRPLDEIVLPATHNSMSAPLPGWFSAEQERGIGGQLEDGIRGLLFDTHYGDKLANGNVRTFIESPSDINEALDDGEISAETVQAAKRLRERLGFRGSGTRGMYLCHTFCELGATPLSDGLEEIHDFLVTHPAEVVVVVNQDAVTPADFVAAVGDAGLAPYVFTPPAASSSWPTLREMIDDDRRLVILAENEAGDAPWYQLAYERLVEETPYTFRSAAELEDDAASCEPNRGPERAPLFLINHWISTDPTPRPSDAEQVNAYDVLLARARACERIRDHLPNLLAVNFYRRGDVFDVAKTLNGL
jgi:hypothetical protein